MKRSDDWDDGERAALESVRDELRAVQDRHRGDPPLELLRAARADALPESLSEAAASHLEHSAWSRALVEGADAADPTLDLTAEERILGRVRAKVREEQPAPRRFRLWLWAPALSAAVIVLAVLVIKESGVSFFGKGSPPPASTVAAVPALPVTSVPGVPAAPVLHLPLEKPEVRFTATALVIRGPAGGPKFVDVVAPGIRAYRDGDYATAARELAALQPRFPNSVEVFFYLGVSRLFLGDAEGGRAALEAARRVSDEGFRPSVDWYLAVGDERAGRRADAHTLLEQLCSGASDYKLKACEAASHIETR